MATTVVSTKLNLDIGNFKSKMQDAKKSIEDLQKSIKDSTGKDFELFKDTDVGKKIEEIKTKAKNLGETFKSLPGPVKAGAVIATTIKLTKELYEAGNRRFFQGIEGINETIQPLVDKIRNIGSSLKSTFESITGTSLNLGSFLEIGTTFEATMSKVKSISGATGEEFDSLKQKAMDLGAETRYSSTQVGQAQAALAQQGFKTKEIIDSLSSVLNLATIGEIGLGSAAEITASGLASLGYTTDQATRYADVLATASSNSGTDVSQFGEAMKNVGGIAGALEIDIEDLGLAIGVMGNSSIKGGEAGTQLKNFLARMAGDVPAVTKAVSKYGLESAKTEIVNGNLTEGLEQMRVKFKDLTNEQKTSLAQTLAGQEGMAGLLNVMNASDKDFNKLNRSLKDSSNNAKKMAELMDGNLKGSLLGLSSAIESKVLQVFENTKESFLEVTDALTEFMRSWAKGDLEGGLGNLENKVSDWSENIPNAITNVVDSMKNFISGGSLDSILNMGGDIVQGICQGIIQNKSDISLGISDLIGKVCDWITINGPTIEQAGATIIDGIKTGIGNNREKMSSALEAVYGVVNTFIDGKKAIIGEATIAWGKEMIEGLIKGIAQDAVTGLGTGFTLITTTIGEFTTDIFQSGLDLANKFMEGFLGQDTWNQCKEDLQSALNWLWEKNGDNNTTSKAQDAGLNDGNKYGEATNKGLQESKKKTNQIAGEIGEEFSQNLVNKLETMDAGQLKTLKDELKSLQTTTSSVANGIGNSFESIRNSSRTSFMGMTNIARNQMVNLANIVNNQCQNARNNATRSFISMKKVISTQITESRQKVTEKMISINAVVNTQAWKARDNATRAFMSLAAVIRTQMANALSSVRSAMSQIAAATNRTLTTKVNISKTITTTNVAKNVQAKAQTFSLAATRSLGGINSLATASYGSPVALASTGVSSNIASNNRNTTSKDLNRPIQIKVDTPLYLDGKMIAKASSTYMEKEIDTQKKRRNRKKGH